MRVFGKSIINKVSDYRKLFAGSKCNFPKILLLSSFVCFVYLYLTPYIAIILLKTAVEKNNPNDAAKYINFPSVRDSLKSQLKISLTDKINIENNKTPFGELGISLLQPLVEEAVDSILDYTVTPKGLSILLRTGELSNNFNKENKNNVNDSASTSDYKFKLYYKNLNRFVLSSSSSKSKNSISTYWHRNGLIHWRLTSIELTEKSLKLKF